MISVDSFGESLFHCQKLCQKVLHYMMLPSSFIRKKLSRLTEKVFGQKNLRKIHAPNASKNVRIPNGAIDLAYLAIQLTNGAHHLRELVPVLLDRQAGIQMSHLGVGVLASLATGHIYVACRQRCVHASARQVDQQQQSVYDQLEQRVVGHLVVHLVCGELKAIQQIGDW